MTIRTMLTTIDNPFDPFDSFSSWYQWDVAAGYHTSALLGRLINDSDQLSDADIDRVIELKINDIVNENFNGKYKKVTREFADDGS